MMVFDFFEKMKSHCLGLAKTLIFPKIFKKVIFSVFLYDLEENIPNIKMLIFDFPENSGIFRTSWQNFRIFEQALKSDFFASLVTPAHFFPY